MRDERDAGRAQRTPTSWRAHPPHSCPRPPDWLIAALVGVAIVGLALTTGLSESSCLAVVALWTAAVLLAPREPAPDRPMAWHLFAAAAAMIGIGALAGPSVGAAGMETLASSVGGFCLVLGTAALGHRRAGYSCSAALLDSTALGVSAGAVLWVLGGLAAGGWSAMPWPALVLALDVAALAQVRFLNSSRVSGTAALRLLSAGLVVGVVDDVMAGLAPELFRALPTPVTTALAAAPFVLWAGAAAHPSRSLLGHGRPAGRAFTVRRVMVVGLAVLVAPALALLALRRGEMALLAPLVVVHVGTVTLALARMSGLVRRLRMQAARLEDTIDTDQLTGLENHRGFSRRLDLLLAGAVGRPRYVLVVSLSGIADLNEVLGRAIADEVIVAAASVVRREGGPDSVVARTGAGQFAVLVSAQVERGEADVIAHRLRRVLDAPLPVRGLQIPAVVVVGITEATGDSTSGAAVLARCGHAVVAARGTHTGVAWYGPGIAEGAALAAELMGELQEAIDAGQLVVHFQPQVDLVTGKVVGVEALVRWMHPARGLLAPDAFIPAAERSGAIRSLTLVVLDRSLAQCAAWGEMGRHLVVAVNLSARNLLDPALVDDIRLLLATYGLPAKRLELEITETMAMVDPVHSAQVLQGLADLGVTLSVDDYGTGYGSLAYLQQLPVSRLKIDRSFVGAIMTDPVSLAIVRSTVDLARQVGLDVVAEGVEDDETLRALRDMGCHVAQGYALGRPVPAGASEHQFEEIEARLREPVVPRPRRA